MKKTVMLVLLLAGLAIAGGYGYYSQVYQPAQAEAEGEAPLQTATVRRGDIVISAQGAGTLVPAVAVGDRVEAGQAVARLDDTAARSQVAQAEFNLAQAGQELASLTSPAVLAAARVAAAPS